MKPFSRNKTKLSCANIIIIILVFFFIIIKCTFFGIIKENCLTAITRRIKKIVELCHEYGPSKNTHHLNTTWQENLWHLLHCLFVADPSENALLTMKEWWMGPPCFFSRTKVPRWMIIGASLWYPLWASRLHRTQKCPKGRVIGFRSDVTTRH